MFSNIPMIKVHRYSKLQFAKNETTKNSNENLWNGFLQKEEKTSKINLRIVRI